MRWDELELGDVMYKEGSSVLLFFESVYLERWDEWALHVVSLETGARRTLLIGPSLIDEMKGYTVLKRGEP